jgi:predicted nuclease of restriction endonuclease-like (RecB) superfamily
MKLVKMGKLNIELMDKIEPKYFTTYDIYRFEPSEDLCDLIGGIEVELRLKRSREDEEKIELSSIYTGIIGYEVEESCKHKEICRGNFYLDFLNYKKWLTNIRDGIKTLSEVIGEDCSKHRDSGFYSQPNKVSRRIYNIELTFINFLNLAYVLYTEGFDKSIPEYILFEPITKMLRELGDTFEGVIASIRAFSLIMG